jgi:hypothetical protein
VATWSPGTSGPNDHFIFVSDQLLTGPGSNAPWAKSGTVAVNPSKPYLAAESQNTYVSWYANGAATNWPCVKASTSSGALVGTIDLAGAFGSVPTNIYLAVASYQTTNGGALVSECPGASGLNIDTNGFLCIPTVALDDFNANGIFDRLEPALGFRILSAQLQPGGFAVNWASMPGRSYQVLIANSLNGPWTNLPGASNSANFQQLFLSYTDATPGATQLFYKIKALP